MKPIYFLTSILILGATLACAPQTIVRPAATASTYNYKQCQGGKVYYDHNSDEYICTRNGTSTVIRLTQKEKARYQNVPTAKVQVVPVQPACNGRLYYDYEWDRYICQERIRPTIGIHLGTGFGWGGGWRHRHYRHRHWR